MRKPSAPQMTYLLAAVANGGYATARDVSATKTVTRNAAYRAGWMSADYRIQEDGRKALAATDPEAYAAALDKVPAAHYALPTRTGDPVPAHLVPDGLVQYDVPAGRVDTFAGYQIFFRPENRLRTIVKAETYEASDGMLSGRVYVSDGKGGYRYAANFSIEMVCYGPENGPRLDLAAEVELAEELRAAQPEMARDLEIPVTVADEIEIVQDESGSAVAVASEILAGRGFGDCPAIEVSVEEARDALAMSSNDKALSLLKVLATAGRDDRLIIMDPKDTRFTAQVATLEGLTGDSRARVGTTNLLTPIAGAMAGYEPDQLNHTERAAVSRGIPLATFRRLCPAVDRIADDDQLLKRCQVARDALVRDLTELGQEMAVRTILGDPREAGYRVALFELRTNTALPERIRKGAMYLELALTSAAKGQAVAASNSVGKAQTALV